MPFERARPRGGRSGSGTASATHRKSRIIWELKSSATIDDQVGLLTTGHEPPVPEKDAVPDSPHSARSGSRGRVAHGVERPQREVGRSRHANGAGTREDHQRQPLLTDAQVKAAIGYNLQAHSVTMLIRIREFLIAKVPKEEWGRLEGSVPKDGYTDIPPESVVDAAFVRAVARYQKFKGLHGPDGKIGPNTFKLFNKQGLEYSIKGGSHPTKENGKNRVIIPKDSPEDKVYDFFRKVILDNKGIFLDKAGYVNIIGIRGGKLKGTSTVIQVDNKYNEWDDTLLVLRKDMNGIKHVKYFAATVDPKDAAKATLPEGTYAYELGTHAPPSGTKPYAALNPKYGGFVPVFRSGKRYLGTEAQGQGTKGGQWINIHTTHGYDSGVLSRPGWYSVGCSVVDGVDKFNDFMADVKAACKKAKTDAKKENAPGQTIIYYTVLSAARIEGFSVEKQERKSVSPPNTEVPEPMVQVPESLLRGPHQRPR